DERRQEEAERKLIEADQRRREAEQARLSKKNSEDKHLQRMQELFDAAAALEKDKPDDLDALAKAWSDLRLAGAGTDFEKQADEKLKALQGRRAAATKKAAENLL